MKCSLASKVNMVAHKSTRYKQAKRHYGNAKATPLTCQEQHKSNPHYLIVFLQNTAYNLSHLANLNWLRSLPCFLWAFLKVSFLRLLADLSIMVHDQNFHSFGKYLGKLLNGCLQLDFLAECRKVSLTTLACV